MAFKDLSATQQSLQLLQRSLERGRLAHGYLFSGNELESLESIARTLAKTLNCENPVRKNGVAVDCCDCCLACQKIERWNHPDVHWVRPESKSRIITVAQMRELMREIQLKPSESRYKVAVMVAADRLRPEGANAFLKTLEEPPPDSVLVLLTTEPQRVIETIVSRCLRLSFGNGRPRPLDDAQREWLGAFSELASQDRKSLMGRYCLLDTLLKRLAALRTSIEENLTARSPLQQYQDAEKNLVERWEDELAASVEAEYRRHRAELLGVLQWWLRDVWLLTLGQQNHSANPVISPSDKTASGSGAGALERSLLSFPELAATDVVAQRLSPFQSLENLQVLDQLQRWLGGNVQEALALEVGLLKLHL
jgi:DNA polymerase III subunit delta'